MSRSALRSVLELRTPLTRLPPSFLLPLPFRTQRALFNSTAQHVEPSTSISDDFINTTAPAPKRPALDAAPTAAAAPANLPPPSLPRILRSSTELSSSSASTRNISGDHMHGPPSLSSSASMRKISCDYMHGSSSSSLSDPCLSQSF